MTNTFSDEDRLPRVPLPTVQDSCSLLLEWCAPLLTADELATTEAAVSEFLAPDSPAHVLHADLERYNDSPGVLSWLDDFWRTRYLGRRDRIALNANFFFLFKDSDALDQVDRAAGLIASSVAYKALVDAGQLPPVVVRGQAQSMRQHRYLFSATRIPGADQDTVRAPYTDESPGPATARHIVVFHRGRMFQMDVLDEQGEPYATSELADGLRTVLTSGESRYSPVGHLTTKARAAWAASRQALIAEDPVNADALDVVETALFCLSLEDDAPADKLSACDALLHGDSANRWFDKAVSFVVFADGRAGINVEHCLLDGTTILAFVDRVLGTPTTSAASGKGIPKVEPIRFVLGDALRADVDAAGQEFADYAAATATTELSFEDMGADRIKQLGMSPDSLVQAAYQLAHQRAKGLIGATYESIATRQFQNGRTEAMRVVTPEMVRFVHAMQDPGADAATRRAALAEAGAKHVARAKQCQAGQAPEQHLWELQMIQRRRGAELGAAEPLALYESPGWLIMRDDYLSTSSAPSHNIQYFGFGSTSSRCIGVAYVLLPSRLNVYLSTPQPVAEQMYEFADALRDSLRELIDLLAG
ncbi:choline/carnitine O-acyltransferase [Kibdelosporangium phytohabitans]|uniref:Carnitine O-acetyltransferase n=1 Tax=Kibdelosporangium phytohabitans TaxID=860235 RepID=A0A0N9I9C0_9PSEU|nr:choline/carnitine O-acyltransferase [Kibdelosporangium phytohabitans]ALG15038.1 carnitine O-acetyltransferase [Kibdelosporangium phytohabitans]MBE1468951.1 carnitine O-acetyltransferase [Kibdelosporangium phytohabitans]